MAVLASTLRGRVMKFHSAATAPAAFQIVSVEGVEEISRPYRFEIELVSRESSLDPWAMLREPVYIGVKQGVSLRGGTGRGIQTLKFHGVLASFEQKGSTMGWVSYRAVLVPRLWRLSIGRHSRIFQDLPVPQIVEQVLKEAGFSSDDYEFRTNARPYPKREYVVQYQESDLDFISRLLEHEGIFYHFEHGEEQAKVVFGDKSEAFRPVQGESTIAYRPPQAAGGGAMGEWFEQEVVRGLTVRVAPVPAGVVLRDYNYRTPSVDLKVSALIQSEGFGTHFEYGNHYKNQDEGRVYAGIRAEELNCRKQIFFGEGSVRSFHGGHTFTLAEHYRDDFNTSYLITRVRHKATQSIELQGVTDRLSATYENEFESIPAETVFRPERVTTKPRIHGVLHAKIDAAGDGKYAEIDDQGRYKVQLPIDLSGLDQGRATRWIRMAQPYSGPDYGFHFPLHKGTEVLLVHIDGDPDRPIIASTVPNPEMASPVKGGNQTQCVIRTGGGSQMVIEDTEGKEQIKLTCPKENTSFHMGDGCIGMSTDGNHDEACKGNRTETTVCDREQSTHGNSSTSTDGSETRTVKGSHSDWIHGPSVSMYLAMKTEIVAGVMCKLIGGAYVEAVVGATVHLGHSAQIHKNSGPHLWESPQQTVHGQVQVTVHSGGMVAVHAPLVDVDGKTSVTLHSGGSRVDTTPAAVKVSTPDFGAVSSGPAFLKGDTMDLKSTGGMTLEGATVGIKGGPVSVNEGNLVVDKGSVTVNARFETTKSASINGSALTVD